MSFTRDSSLLAITAEIKNSWPMNIAKRKTMIDSNCGSHILHLVEGLKGRANMVQFTVCIIITFAICLGIPLLIILGTWAVCEIFELRQPQTQTLECIFMTSALVILAIGFIWTFPAW